jgi:hypothetical protein
MADNVFYRAIEAHVKWKIRLRNHLDGTSTEVLDPEVICKDDQCTLGQWIYGEGQQYNNLPAYENLRQTHANFHKCAAEIIRKADANEKQEAEKIFGNDYVALSRNITNTLVKMNSALKEIDK